MIEEQRKEMTFTEKDLDMQKFNMSLDEEVNKIKSGPAAKHYSTGEIRTSDDIRKTTYSSKICEEYLVQLQGFKYSNLKWHDVVSPSGDLVEVKFLNNSIQKNRYESYMQGIYNKIKRYNKSRFIYAFQYRDNKYQLVYIFDTRN